MTGLLGGESVRAGQYPFLHLFPETSRPDPPPASITCLFARSPSGLFLPGRAEPAAAVPPQIAARLCTGEYVIRWQGHGQVREADCVKGRPERLQVLKKRSRQLNVGFREVCFDRETYFQASQALQR